MEAKCRNVVGAPEKLLFRIRKIKGFEVLLEWLATLYFNHVY